VLRTVDTSKGCVKGVLLLCEQAKGVEIALGIVTTLLVMIDCD